MITTSYIDHLNLALIRASCINKRIKLLLTNKDVMFRLFCIFFKRLISDIQDAGKLAEDNVAVK